LLVGIIDVKLTIESKIFFSFVFLDLSVKLVVPFFFDRNVIKCNNRIDDGKHDSETNGTEDTFCS
jgi:hypothetical protein